LYVDALEDNTTDKAPHDPLFGGSSRERKCATSTSGKKLTAHGSLRPTQQENGYGKERC
jgi:hypothetical protein